jgi:hypothetical protein
MTIKKNTFSALVLELFFPSIANCKKLKIQKNTTIDFPYCGARIKFIRVPVLYAADLVPTFTLLHKMPNFLNYEKLDRCLNYF